MTAESTPLTAKVNHIGLSRDDYSGGKSTLCTGCGHDSITNHIISAIYQSAIHPFDIVKLSGIGCSSKTPGYFLGKSHGFNAIHGRMAPVATGAIVAHRQMIALGISGDGDTASIGLGGFAHMVRRNVPMTYIVANNGVYGLTKGQFSATADKGSLLRNGIPNSFSGIDLCSMALDLGCTFVARSFSGDAKQLVPLISAALRHQGLAFIDVISPCVAFNNHDGSSKSYTAVKDQNVILQELGFIQAFAEKKVDYPEGGVQEVELPDGSLLILRKLNSKEHDIQDAQNARALLHKSRSQSEILTGLFYFQPSSQNFIQYLNLTDLPLAQINESQSRPSANQLKAILEDFR